MKRTRFVLKVKSGFLPAIELLGQLERRLEGRVLAPVAADRLGEQQVHLDDVDGFNHGISSAANLKRSGWSSA
jgi:hypothetical protein